ncbi:MAG: aminotransferase class I/II-fold pyridoxal phosphate-dependent enzyme [Chloroflexi bacterium]|nr:MAG: aminotransferase class I/II-fold pyridoxal phosphate-dependent enzyme [Chloroflexota bacterium]TME16568.1 MAG: aminotransferase class I/II-fold pyridoxal phosphate-dependent enzyme [Chloroflexota bacterium]
MALPPLSAGPAEMLHSGIREISNIAIATPGTVRLDVGQPDFRTPDHIGEAAKRAIDEGWTFYTHTQGLLSLRERIAAKVGRVNGYSVSPAQIACAVGGVGALAATLAATLAPGDEVLLPDPGWPNYRMMPPWLGARAVFYPLEAATGFLPDMERLETLVTPRTRVLLINSPANPTGAVFPRNVMETLADFAVRHDLWLVSDECYDQVVLEGEHVAPASFLRDGRVISIYTFSKTYAMTGWRLGYAVGSEAAIDSITKVLESNTSGPNTIAQKAAEAALDGPQDCVAEMVAAYRHRRDLTVDLLAEAEMLVSVPQGAFYCMADVSAAGMNSRDLALWLVRERGLSIAPGTAFGQVAAGEVRISLASSDADLREGVTRLAEAVRIKAGR